MASVDGVSRRMGRQDDAEALGALHRVLELGVNFFDTALGYGNGHSEYLIGFLGSVCAQTRARHSGRTPEAV